MLSKLRRYQNHLPKRCVYCLVNESLGYTAWGPLGCEFCQQAVDDYMKGNYKFEVED